MLSKEMAHGYSRSHSNSAKAKYGVALLESSHMGGGDRRMVNSVPPWQDHVSNNSQMNETPLQLYEQGKD